MTEALTFDMAGVHVMLAMPTHRDIPPSTVVAIVSTQHLLMSRGIDISVQVRAGNSPAASARSRMAHDFLKGPCTHLFWVDSDIVWEPEGFLRLLCLATRLDVVGAAYTFRRDEPQFVCFWPNGALHSNEYGCLPTLGLGLGFTCVQRKVMEALAARTTETRRYEADGEPVLKTFRADDEDGVERTEDMAFFADVIAMGFTPWAALE